MLKALVCDIDGTLTDTQRRVDTGAIGCIRKLVDRGVEVVLASGNTSCFMDALCRMIGTSGTFIAENGGVYRIGFDGSLHLDGDQSRCWEAFRILETHFRERGTSLQLYSDRYRFTDLAFGRTVSAKEVKEVLSGMPIKIVDTGYAIHLQVPEVNKGTALVRLAPEIGLSSDDFLAIGDSVNDLEMLSEAGTGVAVANANPRARDIADWVTQKKYGEGVVEAIQKYWSTFSKDIDQPRYSP
ncbi:MAG: phosphoglycolate phosphatase [Methanomicrobiales archaeon]|nr:phosphoglycolate phosphatase [Methanomicrobiales archaeon]